MQFRWSPRPALPVRAALIIAAAASLGACVSVDADGRFGDAARNIAAGTRDNIPAGGGYEHLGAPYVVAGRTYVPAEDPNYSAVGYASWYGADFHGQLTANGEVYDMNALTAAHPTLPLPSYVRVTNLDNGASVVVRVNDRGPFHDDRIIDLSAKAAELLDMTVAGVARVEVDYIGRASLDGNDERMLLATYQPPNANRPVAVAYDAATRTVSTSTHNGLFDRLADNAAAMVYQPAALVGGFDPLAGLLGGAQTYAPLPQMTAAQRAAELVATGGLLPTAGPVVVQVGVFSVRENANDVAMALTDFGTVTVDQLMSANGPIWSVQVVTTAAQRQATIDAAAAAGAQGAYALAR